jgi:predicted acylesterase/phospholipase RssA
MVAITLPDGNRQEYDSALTGAELAGRIGPGLAKAALAIRIDGELFWDGGILSNTPVEVVFDPTRTSYSELLHHFFARHRPALGAQSTSYATKHYRSAIFVANDGQRQIAENVIAAVNDSGRFPAPVATRIEPAATFWEAEAEHQNYLARCSY